MTFTYLLGKVYWQLALKRGAGMWRLIWKRPDGLLPSVGKLIHAMLLRFV